MGMILFTVLNVMGLLFMLYVLAQFWKEGHHQKKASLRRRVVEFPARTNVLVVTHPISRAVQTRESVISMRAGRR